MGTQAMEKKLTAAGLQQVAKESSPDTAGIEALATTQNWLSSVLALSSPLRSIWWGDGAASPPFGSTILWLCQIPGKPLRGQLSG